MARQVRERSRRPYSSPARQAQAAATRRAIIRAAREVFAKSGYGDATIEAIADVAQVSVPTVYAVFGSKPGLLSAVVADGGGDADIRSLADQAMAESAPRERLEAAAGVVRKIMQREGWLLRLLVEAGTGNPDLKAALRQVHEQQRRALERVLRPLFERRALRPGLGLDEGVATFGALASPESYRLLTDEFGWSGARWERWLGDSAVRLLLGSKS
jgi:AcrR family transcriptional regulator